MRSESIKQVISALAVACLITGIGIILWGVCKWLIDVTIYSNERFLIKKIEVNSEGGVSVNDIIQWSGVKQGQNLLAIDLYRIKRDLELVPRIKSVSIERQLPDTLKIYVQERVPFTKISLLGQKPDGSVGVIYYFLDYDGYVIGNESDLKLKPTFALSSYPTILGLNENDLKDHKRVESPQLIAAHEFLRQFEMSPAYAIDDIDQVDISETGVLHVTTVQGMELSFRIDDFARQLRRWRQIFDYGLSLNKSIAYADFTVTNNIPVRWQITTNDVVVNLKQRVKSPLIKKNVQSR